MTSDFLNDLALVVSKQSGFDNIIATCLKLNDDEQTYILRVIRNSDDNDDDHGDFLAGMKDIITTVSEKSFIGSANPE